MLWLWWNDVKYCITINILTWYNNYPERSLCAVEIDESWKLGFPIPGTSLHGLAEKGWPYKSPYRGTYLYGDSFQFSRFSIFDITLVSSKLGHPIFWNYVHIFGKRSTLLKSSWGGKYLYQIIFLSHQSWKIRISLSNPMSTRSNSP